MVSKFKQDEIAFELRDEDAGRRNIKKVRTQEALAMAVAAQRINGSYIKNTRRFSEPDNKTQFANKEIVKYAFASIDKPINTATTRYYIDLVGLNAIHARVALYAKDWPTAITSSTVVINALPLASRATYPSIWRDQSVSEVAFASLFNTGEFLSRLAGDVFSPPTNRSQF